MGGGHIYYLGEMVFLKSTDSPDASETLHDYRISQKVEPPFFPFLSFHRSFDRFIDLAGDVNRDMAVLDVALVVVVVEGRAFDDGLAPAANSPMIARVDFPAL